jgi:hypothetical protein
MLTKTSVKRQDDDAITRDQLEKNKCTAKRTPGGDKNFQYREASPTIKNVKTKFYHVAKLPIGAA